MLKLIQALPVGGSRTVVAARAGFRGQKPAQAGHQGNQSDPENDEGEHASELKILQKCADRRQR